MKKLTITLLIITIFFTMFACGKTDDTNSITKQISSLEDLAGARIGVLNGSSLEQAALESIPNANILFFNTYPDTIEALFSNKIDAYIIDEPIYRKLAKERPGQTALEHIMDDEYGFIFPKDQEHEKLCLEMNEFLTKLRSDGTIEEIDKVWFGDDASIQKIDLSRLTGENGKLLAAINTDSGMPFVYVQDGECVGYELDILVRFCEEYGYKLDFQDYQFSGLLAAVSTGKSDIGLGCISITEERKQSLNFSTADYIGGIVVAFRDKSIVATQSQEDTPLFEQIKESFNKTFIRENRWQLFVNGISITLLITIISIIAGTILGFLIFMAYRKEFKPFAILVDALTDIFQKNPIIVLLMVFYYILFGKTNASGIWVSIICFTIMFSFNIARILNVGVKTIDKGQREAALSLGFTDIGAFFKVILPQAMEYIFPSYKEQIIELLKDTAIVGYIAVQDLTRISDIVRVRTYEAFFPLIITSVFYFVIAWMLVLIVKSIEIKFTPKRRSEAKILKGVKTK